MDHEGRYIELVFDNLTVISTYLPSGSSGDIRQQIKFECLDFLKPFLEKKLSSNQNVILCGDLNIAHQEIDLKNHKGNKKNSGFLPEERDWISTLISKRHWVDAYRELFPQEEELAYTWWSNRGQAWANNVGWRIDYQMTSSDLSKKILKAFVFKDERFSDHAPLIIDYDFEL
jgi:exodeoxyribonuclease-3